MEEGQNHRVFPCCHRGKSRKPRRICWHNPVGSTLTFNCCLQIQKVILDVGSAADSHTKPGQFLQVKVEGGKPGFYAIASPPDPNNQGVVELLVKNQGETAEALCSKSAGGHCPWPFQPTDALVARCTSWTVGKSPFLGV